jgi:hypothetical protein
MTRMTNTRKGIFELCRTLQRLALSWFIAASAFIFVLCMHSCTPAMFRNLESAGDSFTRDQAQLFRPGMNESAVYKTTVNYKDKQFSALTYVNGVSDSVFKVVLLTTFGNTLLEAEISHGLMKVNNVVSYLDRKPLLKLFEKDWQLLLAGNLTAERPKIFSRSPAETVHAYKVKSANNLYHYSVEKKSLMKIESWKGKKLRTIVMVTEQGILVPESFVIGHPSLNLSMNMSLLKKVGNEPVE